MSLAACPKEQKFLGGGSRMRRSGLRLVTVGVLAAAAWALPQGAAAESATPDARTAGIQEVIVTARKREEAAQDVPIAITALSEELTSSTIRDVRDLNGYAPNVQIDENGSRGGGGASITIRGISPTRSDDNSFDSPIAVMIDGIYLGSLAGQVLENFDLERVEILRGPQGTLFGKNTVGGVVNVIRSRPTGEWGARTKLTIGQEGQREIRFVGNGSLVEDVLAGKVFYSRLEDDGLQRNITLGNRVAVKDYENYGATLLYTPVESFEALLTIERFKDEGTLDAFHTNYNTAGGVIPVSSDPNDTNYFDTNLAVAGNQGFATCARYPTTCRTSLSRPNVSENDTENRAVLDTDAYTLHMNYDITEELRLVSITGVRNQDEYRIFDFDGSSAPYITIERFNKYEQSSQELRLDGNFDNIKFTVGGYYYKSEFTQDWITGGEFWASLFGAVASTPALWTACQNGAFAPIACDRGIPGGIPLATSPAGAIPTEGIVTQILFETQETTSYAAFGQVDYTFLERFTATAGIRFTKEKKDFQAGQSYLSNVARQRARNFPAFANLDNEWEDTSLRFGLTYQITDDALVYFNYAEGFNSGGFFGVNQNIRDFERDQYDPEEGQTYELGLKSQWLDNRLRVNVTAFLNKFENKQESSVAFDEDTRTVATRFDNVADAEYKGLEIETQFVFNEYFRVFANYGYLDAEYSEFQTDINVSDTATTTAQNCNGQFIAANIGGTCIEDASGLIPRNAPENTLGLGFTASYPFGEGQFDLFAKYTYVDEVEGSLLNASQARVDSRKDYTAQLGYFAPNWSVVAFGRNLTDERIEAFTAVATLFATGTVNRPRTYGLEFSYDF